MTATPQRPAFGSVLASHMASGLIRERPLERHRNQAGRTDLIESGGARAALRQHLLRGFQGFSPRRRFGAHFSHGPAHRAHAPKRAAAGAAGARCGAARRHGARRSIARCREAVPEAPGALYLRPILFGTTANIGAAATPRPRRC